MCNWGFKGGEHQDFQKERRGKARARSERKLTVHGVQIKNKKQTELTCFDALQFHMNLGIVSTGYNNSARWEIKP